MLINISSSIILLGLLLRFFILNSIWLVYIGQMLVGIGGSMVNNLQMTFCDNLCTNVNRPFCFVMINAVSIVGGGAANAIPLLFFTSKQSTLETKNSMQTYNLFTLILNSICFVFTFFVFRKTNYIENNEIKIKSLWTYLGGLWEVMKKLMSHRFFVLSSLMYNVYSGTIFIIGSIFNTLIEKNGYGSVG